MDFKPWHVFFISFLFKEFASISSITSSNSADKYDITKELNDTIVGIFRSVEEGNVVKLIDTMVNGDSANNITWNNGTGIFIFRHVRVTNVISDETRIHYDFSKNEMKIRSPQFIVNLIGFINIGEEGNLYEYFQCQMNFRNIEIIAFKQTNNNHPIGINILDHGALDIKLIVSPKINSTLLQMLNHIVPALFFKNVNHNERFIHSLQEIFDIYTKKKIISKQADFSSNQYRYHYLIPTASFTLYTLKNIIIEGLSNFQWLSYTESPLTYTLVSKNIRGSFNLCSGPATSEMNFFINTFSIHVEQKTNLVRVAAQMYSVIDSKTNTTLSALHSAVIIELMEVAIAWSIMPSMKFQRTMKPRPGSNAQQIVVNTTQLQKKLKPSTTQSPIKYTSQCSTQHTTKPKSTTAQLPSKETLQKDISNTMKSPVDSTPDPLNYDLLFNDVTIKLVSGNESCPEKLECDLLNNLKFTHKVTTIPIGSKDNLTTIKFNANISSINIYVVKSNHSEDPNSCQFQIHVNQIIDVKSSLSTINTTKSGIQFEIKKRIDAALNKIMNQTEHVVQIVKPKICSTFDVCSQSVKIARDVFLNFVDSVLNKCWLVTGKKT